MYVSSIARRGKHRGKIAPMPANNEPEWGKIVHNLEMLNQRAALQMTAWRLFRDGIIWGLGFIVGSTVLTAIVATIVLRFFPDTLFGDIINWITHAR